MAYRQQDDSDEDGVLVELSVNQVTGCRMIDLSVKKKTAVKAVFFCEALYCLTIQYRIF